MSFTQSILFECFKAVLAGLVAAGVFVLGQIVQRFIFEPLADMRKLLGQIAHDLVFYRHFFSAPGDILVEKWLTTTSVYRAHASALSSLPLTIPCYDQLAKIFQWPCRKQALEVASCFIGLSNMSRNPSSDEFAWKNELFETIHRVLKIPKK